VTPQSARNNNPGNLVSGDHWQGLMPAERLTDQQKNGRFAVFEKPEYGFRALAILLGNYKKLYHADTLRRIMAKFAPPSENNTQAYFTFLANHLGVTPDTTIDVTDHKTAFNLCKGIATYETGSWEPYWTDEELNIGLQMAGYQGATA
jgi:hypothetical protein